MSQDQAPARRPSVAEVRAIGQPPDVLGRESEEHWTGHLYMRRISPYVSIAAIRAGLSPNAVTAIMILVGLSGVVVATIPGWWPAVTAALLIQVYLLLDCVDGEVARYTGTTSARGVYLDRLGHYLVEAGLMVALGIRVAGGDEGWVIVGLVAALSVMIEKVETDLVPASRHRSGLDPAPGGASEIRSPALTRARTLSRRLPIHLITHAAEASLLIAAAAIIDAAAFDEPVASRALLVGMLAVTVAVSVLHFVSIWASRRLD